MVVWLLAAPGQTLAQSIDGLWDQAQAPEIPQINVVQANPASTALLVLDIEELTCNAARRPRCLDTVPRIAELIRRAREAGLPVVYSLTPKMTPILDLVVPKKSEPIVASSVDKFWDTDLEKILQDLGVDTVIVTGTAAHGAVLHTATAAGFRGLKVLLPVDCLSAADLYTEQATVQLLLTGPGTRRVISLTRSDLITIQ
ncbi:isochorismatase hydrolase [Desulfovibrio ferrophilus]|uniref:Isochorismatase hydrolase n=2 Tax=Desulfovibrio ferrophilus TaxID=241368 RepID=A0A2Z6B0L6_9BACT|nr:isochorismatase hydrolase [Desulfovibrio ferrophilus]